MGRRVQKTVYAYGSGSWQVQKEVLFVYDGWNLVKETTIPDGGSAVDKFYIWGIDLSQSLQGAGGVGGLLAAVDSSLTYHYLHDVNGNVGQVVNAGDGSVVAHYEYDPFGNLVNQTGDYADENPYRFSTKYHDKETSLHYYGYRYYSTELGRWINRDPIGESGGFNVYGFIANSTINIIDFIGLDFIAIAKRPLDIFPWWAEKYHLGLNIHTSIEYWKCPCTIGNSHEYSKNTLRNICQVADFAESVELLNSPKKNWWIWEKKIEYNRANGMSTYWKKTKIGVSVIVFGVSEGKTLQAFYEPRDRNRDSKVETEWKNIKAKALIYGYAEQENFNVNFKNWPNSNYSAAGNNCHTFSKTMIEPHPIPDIFGHMIGNNTPQNVVDQWNRRTPVDNESKLGNHP